MISEFQELADKVTLLADQLAVLRRENAVLRKSNDVLIKDNLTYATRLAEAQRRVQALLEQLPAEPDAAPPQGDTPAAPASGEGAPR